MSAVEYVIAHADHARTHLHLLNVQPTIMAGDVSVLASAKLVADLRRSAGERTLNPAKTLLNRHSFQHTSEVVFGALAEAIFGPPGNAVAPRSSRGLAVLVLSRISPGAPCLGASSGFRTFL
jgi:hypothetical protein